jgi:hypothetical protein
MTESAELTHEVLLRVAEFLRKLPTEQLQDLASGSASLEVVTRQPIEPRRRLPVRTATAPRSARFDWEDGPTRLHVVFDAKDAARSTVSLTHVRLADAAEAERMKAWWRERLAALRALLEA